MSNIVIGIPCFSNPETIETCVSSIVNSNNAAHNIVILLYNHSEDREIANKLYFLAQKYKHVRCFDYRQNRGLARTWNDIISFAYIENEYDHCVIMNDDFSFVDTGFNDFVKFAHRNIACPVILSEWDYACFIYNKFALDTIGMFDENIFPAYYEDTDFEIRLTKLNLHPVKVAFKHKHIGSFSMNSIDGLLDTYEDKYFPKLREYYNNKWGFTKDSDGTPVKYNYPFNDESIGYKISYQNRKYPYPGHNIRE